MHTITNLPADALTWRSVVARGTAWLQASFRRNSAGVGGLTSLAAVVSDYHSLKEAPHILDREPCASS